VSQWKLLCKVPSDATRENYKAGGGGGGGRGGRGGGGLGFFILGDRAVLTLRIVTSNDNTHS